MGFCGRIGPPIHNMGFCGRLRESPNTWKHFGPEPTQVLNSVISVLLRQETATWGGWDLGSDGVGDRDYGWGVRVCRPFGARGMSSVRYGTRLGPAVTLKINNQHTLKTVSRCVSLFYVIDTGSNGLKYNIKTCIPVCLANDAGH